MSRGRRPAELDDADHRHVADMTRVDRILRAVEADVERRQREAAERTRRGLEELYQRIDDARQRREERDQQILDGLRADLRCSTCHEYPHLCDCADESVDRFRQADGFPGDDGPEAL